MEIIEIMLIGMAFAGYLVYTISIQHQIDILKNELIEMQEKIEQMGQQ